IGGPTGELLETNAQVLSQISTNLGTMQRYRITSLCCAKLEITYSGC
uniref:Uncharacterized protein n=1 Tax=Aegilops tauschii subsp. strangulata TaxID=200361 RepID=A0A453CB34_AEGTS